MATFNLRGRLTAKTPIQGKNGNFLDLEIHEQRFDPNTGELWSDYKFSTLLFKEEIRSKVHDIPIGTVVNVTGVVASKTVTPPNGTTFNSAWLKANNVEVAE